MSTQNTLLYDVAFVDFANGGSVVRGIYFEQLNSYKPIDARFGRALGDKFIQELRENGTLLVKEHESPGFINAQRRLNFDEEWDRYQTKGYTHQLCNGDTPLPVLFEERFEGWRVTTSDFRDAFPEPLSTIEPVMGYKLYWFSLEADNGVPRYVGMREPNAAVWVELMECVRTGFHTLPSSRHLAANGVWQVREAQAWKVGTQWEHYLSDEERLPSALTYREACLAAAEIEIARQRD
jgi:hypothetical protein